MKERWELCIERIKEISTETNAGEKWGGLFQEVASFILQVASVCDVSEEEKNIQIKDEKWNKERVDSFYSGLQENNYVNSYCNPDVAVKDFGKKDGQLLSFLYAEMYSLPAYAAENDIFEILIRMELFIEIYCIYINEDASLEEKTESAYESCYYFISDYFDVESEKRTGEKVDPSFDFAYRLIMESDLSTPDYLYRYGEYISDNEIKTVELLNQMSNEELKKMADTYTEGYRIGFVKGNKDLSIKEVANIVYPLGFEKVVKLAIANFEKMGLKSTLMRSSHSIFFKRALSPTGYYSTSPNRQFEFDHKEDMALFLDKKLVNRRLEVLEEAYIKYKDLSKKHAGPAWIEVFGESNFDPEDKEGACKYSDKQQKLSVSYAMQASQIINTYIPGEERSFTIIAYPIPEIGKDYEAIMKETIALNTLPYQVYEDVQQTIIDALDQCDYAVIKGMNGNETDLKVELCKLDSPNKQTIFENCVADVNIPVGEVFTSPVLTGTNGLLHVKRVFLNGLSYDNLKIGFEDGKTTDYSCENYDSEEKNKKYIKDQILHHYDSLPIGEFAIGTNTTAYVMGKKYGIEDKLPILIAEKTGPHFAVGDTCYSHAEDVAVFNPDQKEIVARDNEVSILRKDEATKDQAYFSCHTDITIPYDELGRLYGVTKDGKEVVIIENGRFVLSGTELLNEAFDS